MHEENVLMLPTFISESLQWKTSSYRQTWGNRNRLQSITIFCL